MMTRCSCLIHNLSPPPGGIAAMGMQAEVNVKESLSYGEGNEIHLLFNFFILVALIYYAIV